MMQLTEKLETLGWKMTCDSTAVRNVVVPDIVALEQAVRILGLVGLLTFNGPKPPGIINH